MDRSTNAIHDGRVELEKSSIVAQPNHGFRAAAAATLPGKAFDAQTMMQAAAELNLSRTVCDESTAITHELPFLARRTMAERIADRPNDHAHGARYEIGKLLGSGGNGQVFAVRDRDCARDVALKVLNRSAPQDPQRLARFVLEAQVTAQLEHPGILPVYDIDVAEDGNVYFTMRKIDGMSLGECIRLAQTGATPAAIATVNDRVGIVLRVSEAVAFAHHRGVIHQDIKPDNIMLGAFGEVVLVDWGTAIGSGTKNSASALAGTPLYMSPEQARRQTADERSDVYCLGATLFHLIMLRLPTWDDDPERFWEKKRIGAIDLPSAAERTAASPRLVDILLKALAPEPGRRYSGARRFLLDLKAWQEGSEISARRDTIIDRLRRAYRRHRPVVLTAAASLVAVVAIGALLWREKLRESSAWRVVASEDFSHGDASLGGRWNAWVIDRDYTRASPVAIERSFWNVRDGALNGDGSSGLIRNLTWSGSLTGDLRIEWAVIPETGTANINCYIGARNRLDGYVFHLGGYAIPTAITLTKGPKAEILVRKPLPAPLEMSRSYRMCMERMDDTVRYWIDGALVIEYRDTEMLVGPEHQAFGFECASSTVSIDDLRISTKPLPLRASPLAVADALYAERLFVSARERYQEYLIHHPDGDQVPMAMFRAARCLTGENRIEDAIAAFVACEREHPTHEVAVDSIARRAALLLSLGREDEARAAYSELARREARPEARSAALLDYSEWLMVNRRPHELSLDDPGLPAVIAALREGIVAMARALDAPVADNSTLVSCAELLNRIGSHRLVLEEYPEQRAACAIALEHLGLQREVVARYPELTGAVVTALIQIGADEELARLFPQAINGIEARIRLGQAAQFLDHPRRDVQALALLQLGRCDEILRDYRAERMTCANTLARLGRWDEIRAEYADVAWFEGRALEQLGRWDERLAMGGDLAYVHYGIAFSRFAAGADAEGEAALATAERRQFPWTGSHHLHFVHFVLGPTMRWRLGQAEAPIASWRRWRVEHRERLGGLPERTFAKLFGEEVSVTWGLEAEILEGVRAELAGRDDVADACYDRYLAKAPDARDAVVMAFIRARRRAP